MYDSIETFFGYFSYSFVVYGMAAGVLVSLCASLLGVTLVVKGYSFMGDGLSHVAFGAMAVAAVLNVTEDMTVVLPVTMLFALWLLRRKSRSGVRGDAVLAMLSSGAMAIGYLLLNRFSASANISGDVCSTLFGSTSILTLKGTDVVICAAMAAVVVGVFVIMYNRIFAVTFDETFAKTTGMNTEGYNLFIGLITAVVIVLAMKIAGALLTSALIVFPAMSAMRVCGSFKKVVLCAGVTGALAAFAGISLSILFSTPVGATVVAVNAAVFCVFYCIGKIRGFEV